MSESHLLQPAPDPTLVQPALESKFATFFHASPVALHVARLDTGAIIDCNEAAQRLAGFSREEMIGRSMTELGILPAEERIALLAAQPGERGNDLPLTVTCKSGQRKKCLVSGAEVEVDGQRCMLVSTVDITARDEAEREHAYLSALIESSFDGIVSRDMDGIITGWNAAAEHILGYSAEEAIGKHISFMVPDVAMSQFQKNHARLQNGIATRAGETQRIAKDGRLVDLAYNTFLVRSARGEMLGVATIARDVSDRKRMEAALRASEERYRFLTESMKDVVWSCDLETLRYIYVSPSITRLLGWTREEALSAPFFAILTPESTQRAWRSLMQGLAEFDAAASSGQEQTEPSYYTGEYEARHKNGARVWLEIVGFLRRNADSGRLEMHGVSRDISERKQAEAALHASERRLQLAARAAGLGVWHWNLSDNSVDWDERMQEIYATSEAEREEKRYHDTWRTRLHPEDQARVEAELEAARSAAEYNSIYRIVLPDGAIRYIQSAGVIEQNEHGQPLRIVGVNQDITQQKEHERALVDSNAELEHLVAAQTAELRATVDELRRANAGKDAFLTAISHELRTPLMGVLSMAELLRAEVRGALNSDQEKYVAAIDESGRRLLSIVNNLLLYTHLMSGQVIVESSTCSLSDLCAAAVHAVRPQAERKRHRIGQIINPFRLAIESDAQCIFNMLKLLLDNAIKFTPDGGHIVVEVSALPEADTVQIAISDTGIGMTPEEIGRLFRPFTQADGSLARRFEGMGIGLAIVHKIVELLDGKICVESEPGQGSQFIVTLPRGDRQTITEGATLSGVTPLP